MSQQSGSGKSAGKVEAAMSSLKLNGSGTHNKQPAATTSTHTQPGNPAASPSTPPTQPSNATQPSNPTQTSNLAQASNSTQSSSLTQTSGEAERNAASGGSTGTPSPNDGSSPDNSAGSSSRSSVWKEKLAMVTNMIYFSSEGNVEELKALIEEGGDPNSTDYDGRSALHLAASEGHSAAVALLLEKGARVNPKDRWGNTPLTDAQRALLDRRTKNYEEIVSLLKSKGGVDAAVKGTQMSDDWEIDIKELAFNKSKLIGKGAFGEIRRVPWRGTPVAVKTVLPSLSGDPQIVKEFRDEVFLLVKLRHPNVVQFLGCVTKSQPMCLVTEYLPGGDLHEVLKAKGALPPKTAVAYALDIARGMNYLHNHKPESIIHRDLKPRNLLRDGGDHMKVADFGLSKLVKVTHLHEMYKMTGETGSYRYMAPEVFKHEAYDRSVDVYSFGVILYEMFEGLPPFAKTLTAEGVAWKVAMEGVRPPFKSKNYPAGVKELIALCWSEIPMQRPSFMGVIDRLEEIEKRLKKEEATGTLDSTSPLANSYLR